MTPVRTLCALLLALFALSACGQPGAGARAPEQPVALLADLDPALLRKQLPDAEIAIGISPVADIEEFFAGVTTVVFLEDSCEYHDYNYPDGRLTAESICGGERYESEGRRWIDDDGLSCNEFYTEGWSGGCYGWRHTGEGDLEWWLVTGEGALGGTSVHYIGNLFGL